MDMINCPSEEILERHLRGLLSDQQRSAIESHVQKCALCAAKVKQAHEEETLLVNIRRFYSRCLNTVSEQLEVLQEPLTIEQAQRLAGDAYRLVKKAGQGATGQVFQAIDLALDRPVAIKFLTGLAKKKDNAKDRLKEARIMGQLNHPNIAHIYQIGQTDGIDFIVMEWVDGIPLSEAWRNKTISQRLALFSQALEAIAAAHKRDIVHRDIKPSNILVRADSTVKVLDFGIAVDLNFSSTDAATCYRGTPSFSAPEQVTPPVNISPATDVFALGILLYLLLTDELPFPQTHIGELFEAIRTQHPELPSALQEKIPIPLQNICLKALEKNPQRRYRNAQELFDDIQRYLRGEKVWSKPSFVADKIQQEIYFHRQKIKVWRDNALITPKEYDKLEQIYQRVVEPSDPSIIEARALSLSQVCLYLGGWIATLGCFILFYKNWEHIPLYFRPAPAAVATILMILFGGWMRRRKETRLMVGFFATANFLVPITLLLILGQWHILSPERHSWGTESIYNALRHVESYLLVGNAQLLSAAGCWLIFSLIFFRLTQSSIFALFGVLSFLACLTVCYLIAGIESWPLSIAAGRYLYAGLGLYALGAVLDRQQKTHMAWPCCLVGLITIVTSLTLIAISKQTLIGWLGATSDWLNRYEKIAISFICNGVMYLAFAKICEKLNTLLQRHIAVYLNWLGPLHILAPLRIIDNELFSVSENHQIVYRVILPIASLGFVFGSVSRQMKSFFFAGLGGIAAAAHKLTVKYFDQYFAWPVGLIVAGAACMMLSWFVSTAKALKIIKSK